MGKWLLLDAIFAVILIIITSYGIAADKPNGAELFKEHCIRCHPIAAMMTDSRIVDTMRNPKRDMPKFDKDKISDKEANAIADYIKFQISMKSICVK